MFPARQNHFLCKLNWLTIGCEIQPGLSGRREIAAATPYQGDVPVDCRLVDGYASGHRMGPLLCNHSWQQGDPELGGDEVDDKINLA